MSTTSSSIAEEHRRKRVRKGTRSCWECKRRKIRCQLSSENVSVCAGCLARGTTCLSQEYPEEHDTPSGNQIGERLGRVELLLEKVVSIMSEYDEEEKAQKSLQTPESIGGNDVLTPFSSNAVTNENAPILSLFDNQVIGRRETDFQAQNSIPSPQMSGTKTPSCRPTKIERLRQTLGDLLPSQADADLLCESSNCWLLIHALSNFTAEAIEPKKSSTFPPTVSSTFSSTLPSNSPFTFSSTFDLAEISKQQPTVIARTLLYIAICIQQLPPNFDTSLLHLPISIEARVDRYISTVQTLISSDDEVVSTIVGLECLLLQGIFHINAGNPRRAWLTFRRALSVGQLMGIHRKNCSIPGGRAMWYQILQADRYLCLLLGLPAGSVDEDFGPEETFQNPAINKDQLFTRKLTQISGKVIERNQTDNTHTYAATQEIDEELESLGKEMPPSWWTIPDYIPNDRSPEAADAFDRLMFQMWYFQLQALLHLPFMLRAATERRYEYSKFCCLKASREMMYRYHTLRAAEAKAFCCKVVDFGALTATVTLLLDLLEPTSANESREVQDQRAQDRALIQMVMNSMEEMTLICGDAVAKQCVNIIKTLLSAESPAGVNSGNLRLNIPYFGTINIARPPLTPSQNPNDKFPVMPQQQTVSLDQQTSAHPWTGLPFPNQSSTHAPVVSFMSSQFPQHVQEQGLEEWELQQADTVFFDSLLNTDIEGNWIF